MTITTTGYVTKRYPEIIAELRQGLIDASGNPNLDLSDDSLLGVLNNIYGLAYSDLYSLAAAQWANMDVDTAEGLGLDALVRRVGIERLLATKSAGSLQFTSVLGTVIAAGTQVRDLAGVVVETTATLTLDTNNLDCIVLTPVAVNNFNYSVNINGTNYNYLSDGSATVVEVVNGLVASLSSAQNIVAINFNNTLKVNATLNSFNSFVGNNITITTVCKSVTAQALLAGEYILESGTLTRLVFPNNTITVNNKDSFLTGRFEETDAELRARFKDSVGGLGNATVIAIKSKLAQLSGVTKAFVEENTTMQTLANGIPPKAIECTVKGGTNLDVATKLFEVKPAGIETYGNVSQTIIDDEGTPQVIYFTRPVEVYIHCTISYSLYNEELFPTDGVTQITNAVINAGNGLDISEDVIIQRLVTAIYNNVQGISNISMQIGKTYSPSDTPLYSNSNIAIGVKEESVFDVSRISVTAA